MYGWMSNAFGWVPAMTYYVIISLIPLTVAVATVCALILGNGSRLFVLQTTLSPILPNAITNDLIGLIKDTRASSPILLVGSLLGAMWTVSGGLTIIQGAMRPLLDVPEQWGVRNRIRLIAIGGLTVVMLAASVVGVVLGADVFNGVLVDWFRTITSPFRHLVGSWIVVTVLLRIVPGHHIRWSACLVGAFPAALGLQLVPQAVSLYLATIDLQAAQLFAAVLLVVTACYVIAACFILAGSLAATIHRTMDVVADNKLSRLRDYEEDDELGAWASCTQHAPRKE